MANRSIEPRLDAESLLHDLFTSPWSNAYCGTAEELISAGLALPSQFPGQPGMPKTSIGFYRGCQLSGAQKHIVDEHYLHIQRYGKKFIVRVGFSAAEQQARQIADQTIASLKARTSVPSAAERQSARFVTGDIAYYQGQRLRMVQEYGSVFVANASGAYVDAAGQRGEERPGYACMTDAGDLRFCPAYFLSVTPRPSVMPSYLKRIK